MQNILNFKMFVSLNDRNMASKPNKKEIIRFLIKRTVVYLKYHTKSGKATNYSLLFKIHFHTMKGQTLKTDRNTRFKR